MNQRLPESVPNPMKDPIACGREGVTRSQICDPDGLLLKEEKDRIEGHINGLKKAEMGVAIIGKISAKYVSRYYSDVKAAEKFARSLHDTWGVGNSNTNNGLLLFLSIEDGVMYMSRGRGLQKLLSYSQIDSLFDVMRPRMREKKYALAIEEGIVYIDTILSGTVQQNRDGEADDGEVDSSLLMLFLITVFVCAFNSNSSTNKFTQGQNALSRLLTEIQDDMDEQDPNTSSAGPSDGTEPGHIDGNGNGMGSENKEATTKPKKQGNKFRAKTCPICLDDLKFAKKDEDIGDIDTEPGNKDINQVDEKGTAVGLQCGHAFCRPCITEYLKKNSSRSVCPICREPVEGSSGQDARNSGASDHIGGSSDNGNNDSSCSAQFSSSNIRTSPLQRELEWRFRLQSMHRLYPEVVNMQSLNLLNQGLSSGNIQNFQAAVQLRINEVQQLAEARSTTAARSGSHGSSRISFGGGTSSGGRGGKW